MLTLHLGHNLVELRLTPEVRRCFFVPGTVEYNGRGQTGMLRAHALDVVRWDGGGLWIENTDD